MSNDFQATISTQMGQTLAQLQQVQQQIQQLTKATNDNNSAHGRFQGSAAGAFKTAHDGAQNLTHRVRELSRAASLAGGEFGHLGEVMRLMAGGGTGLAAIGLGAAAVGLAIEAWNTNMQRSIDSAGRLVDEENKLTEAIRRGEEARGKSAASAAESTSATSLVGAFGSKDAEARAQAITKATNLPIEDVRKALAGSLKVRGGRGAQDNAVAAAILFQQAGVGTMSEGMDRIAEMGHGGRSGTPSQIAARARGMAITGSKYWNRPGQEFTTGGLDSAIGAQGDLGLLRARGEITKSKNQTTVAQEADAAAGRGTASARIATAFERNPVLEQLVEIARSNREQEKHLAAQARAEVTTAGGSFLGKLWYMAKVAAGQTKFQELIHVRSEHAAATTPTMDHN